MASTIIQKEVAVVAVEEEETKKESKYIKINGFFVCPECGQREINQNTMFYHLARHAGVKKYKCSVEGCDKAFLQKSGLTQHLKQVHPPDDVKSAFACPFCDHDTAKTKANLLIHIGRKHGVGWIPERSKSGTCSGPCGGSTQSSGTAYGYHAVSCFIDDAPEDIRETLIERGLINIKGFKK